MNRRDLLKAAIVTAAVPVTACKREEPTAYVSSEPPEGWAFCHKCPKRGLVYTWKTPYGFLETWGSGFYGPAKQTGSSS